MTIETIKKAFPTEYSDDTEIVWKKLNLIDEQANHNAFNVNLNHETLAIPQRIYINPEKIKKLNQLNNTQR